MFRRQPADEDELLQIEHDGLQAPPAAEDVAYLIDWRFVTATVDFNSVMKFVTVL